MKNVDILYQDNRIVVALKPCGVLSTDEAGGMPSLLRQELNTECIRTVHRLDAQVGGVMVFARSKMAASLLSQQIRERIFSKEYLAVVHGQPPQSGTLTDLLGRDKVRRITYVADAPGLDIQEAVLDYEVLGLCDGLSLVKIHLHTGRTHQIRVQFQSRGWPLVGDRKYGQGDENCPIALWSYRLQFTHPETGEVMDLSHRPPESYPWTLFSWKSPITI